MNKFEAITTSILILGAVLIILGLIGQNAYENKKFVEYGYCTSLGGGWQKCPHQEVK